MRGQTPNTHHFTGKFCLDLRYPFQALLEKPLNFYYSTFSLQFQVENKQKLLQNGLLSTLPYFVMFIVNLLMSQIADILVKKEMLSLEVCRKLFNSIGEYVHLLKALNVLLR